MRHRVVLESVRLALAALALALATAELAPATAATPAPYEIYVTNEISGDLSLIDGATLKVAATVPLGKRPRGVEATADGRALFVALSGSPIAGPPPPGGVRKDDDDDDDDPPADKSADGIGHFDIVTRKLSRIIRGVSDPEKLAVTPDGKKIVVASEDTGTALILDAVSGKTLASFLWSLDQLHRLNLPLDPCHPCGGLPLPED